MPCYTANVTMQQCIPLPKILVFFQLQCLQSISNTNSLVATPSVSILCTINFPKKICQPEHHTKIMSINFCYHGTYS